MSEDNKLFNSDYTMTLSNKEGEILSVKDKNLNKLLSLQEEFKSLTDASFSTRIIGSDIFLYEGSGVK